MNTNAVTANPTPAQPIEQSGDTTTTGNVIALRSSTQALGTTEVRPALDPVQSARAKAYESIALFVDESRERLSQFAKQREAALAVLREPPPEPPMKMSDEEWKGFIVQKAIAMENWNSGSNDNGGKNTRESNAINEVDNTLTTNAKYMTYEDAIAMLDYASGRGGKLGQGLQGTTLQSGRNTFEDGGWQNVFNGVRSLSAAAQTEYEGQMAAWKQRQATAKLELANVTSLMGSTEANMGKTIVAFNDMMQKDAINQTRRMTQQLADMPSMQPTPEETDDEKGIEPITVTVNTQTDKKPGKPNTPLSVKVTVNLDRGAELAQTYAARSEPINVSSRFGQG